jgi:hypothetical protein
MILGELLRVHMPPTRIIFVVAQQFFRTVQMKADKSIQPIRIPGTTSSACQA